MPKKPPAPQCPMLKEYLRTLQPTGPATRELPEWFFLLSMVLGVGTGLATHRIIFGFIAFFFVSMVLFAISTAKSKPRNANERLHMDAYKAAKYLKGKLIDESQSHHLVPEVLEALDAAARSAVTAKQQLALLPPSLGEIKGDAMGFIETSMLLAILAAKPCVRRDDQSRKDFEALCADTAFVESVVGQIEARMRAISEVERDASLYQETSSPGTHLRDALNERLKAEAELGSPIPTTGQMINLGE